MGPVSEQGPLSQTPCKCSVDMRGYWQCNGWPRIGPESAEFQVSMEEVEPRESGPHGGV